MKYFKNCSLILVGFIFLSVILFSISRQVEAISLPYFDINIIVESVGGDSNFSYALNSNRGDPIHFDIQTQNGINNHPVHSTLLNFSDNNINIQIYSFFFP